MGSSVAVLLDFDGTLTAEESLNVILEDNNVSQHEFWDETQRLVRQIDPRYEGLTNSEEQYLWALIEFQKKGRIHTLSSAYLQEIGKKVPLHLGVLDFIFRLKKEFDSTAEKLSLEFYVLSSGLKEVIMGSAVGEQMNRVIGATFFKKNGEYCVGSYVDNMKKCGFVHGISTNHLPGGTRMMPAVYHWPSQKRRIPLYQMIYIGDGSTDFCAMHEVRKGQGAAIGVGEKRGLEEHCTLVVAPDYRSEGEAFLAIKEEVWRIGRKNI